MLIDEARRQYNAPSCLSKTKIKLVLSTWEKIFKKQKTKDPTEITKRLKRVSPIETKQWIRTNMPNSETIILKCPHSQSPIKIPGKHPLCKHLRVFDVETIIEDAVNSNKNFYRKTVSYVLYYARESNNL